MQDKFSVPFGAPITPDGILEKIEFELNRLREKRPALAQRIFKAGNILVTHLSCPRQKMIRARVRKGRVRFLVRGSDGTVYVVEPETWGCSCPDAHRRGQGCKHSLAVYVLLRASRPAPKPLPCAACGKRLPRRVLMEVVESLTYHQGDLLCAPCWFDSDAEAL